MVSNPDADHIGGFLDVFDAFPVETVYVSGDPNSTLTYNTFLRGVSDERATTEILRTGMLMDWGGVRADACVPEHPVPRATIPSTADRRRLWESATAQLLKFAHVALWDYDPGLSSTASPSRSARFAPMRRASPGTNKTIPRPRISHAATT